MRTEEIWSLLVCTGYLTYEPNSGNPGYGYTKIPNKKLHEFWGNYIMNYFERIPSTISASLQEALLKQDVAQIHKEILALVINESFRDNVPCFLQRLGSIQE